MKYPIRRVGCRTDAGEDYSVGCMLSRLRGSWAADIAKIPLRTARRPPFGTLHTWMFWAGVSASSAAASCIVGEKYQARPPRPWQPSAGAAVLRLQPGEPFSYQAGQYVHVQVAQWPRTPPPRLRAAHFAIEYGRQAGGLPAAVWCSGHQMPSPGTCPSRRRVQKMTRGDQGAALGGGSRARPGLTGVVRARGRAGRLAEVPPGETAWPAAEMGGIADPSDDAHRPAPPGARRCAAWSAPLPRPGGWALAPGLRHPDYINS
jgi:hypothetical protein